MMEKSMTTIISKLSVAALSLFLLTGVSVQAETPAAVQKAVATEPAKDPAFGKWRSRGGKVIVEITSCKETKLCANIVGLAKPNSKNGKPKLDSENPDASLRARPLIGLQVVSGMERTGKNKWKGKIYNADDGRTYAATASFSGNKLVIEACWGPFCKKNRFTRAK
jgi:uncharacterized protein (DUF2147 family)